MTLTLRPADQRGHANHGWLDSFHSFSFADYFDAAHMGFRSLRVINDDVIQGGGGFDTHGHRDMEIVTYVVDGAVAHQDTTGGKGIIPRGQVQYMSAGTGLRHSEFNASDREPLRLLQIWIVPPRPGLPPSYAQGIFSDADKHNQLRLIAGAQPEGNALAMHQDVGIYACLMDAGASLRHGIKPGRGVWIQVVDGDLTVNGTRLKRGDGLAVEDESELRIIAGTNSEFLLFDLA
ncbi:quercetin 2,3-dioxygenase [Paramagnetospirillum kuznetsovii]|uniref:Quercetin 2,3-dioxygenase n=1 Tax=Paramagnetospirillum kuznetsovii TaxID=2053833 RepID=A0A364NVS6_9PROT|nr:pirin family protein [Paramagnetospirillum kuznetsovii]RAU21162.1 quercetin 2,3-dioxygenase [Paramagnetospirillum kuznetsovii]